VWAADVDGDGLLDVLVGDRVTLIHPQKGVDEDTARTELAAWSKKQREFFSKPQGEDEASQKQWQETYAELEREKEKFAVNEMTGFVWLLRQKAAAPVTGNGGRGKPTPPR
jgi:hypothetical protein